MLPFGKVSTSRNQDYGLDSCTCQCDACTNGLTDQMMRMSGRPFKATNTSPSKIQADQEEEE